MQVDTKSKVLIGFLFIAILMLFSPYIRYAYFMAIDKSTVSVGKSKFEVNSNWYPALPSYDSIMSIFSAGENTLEGLVLKNIQCHEPSRCFISIGVLSEEQVNKFNELSKNKGVINNYSNTLGEVYLMNTWEDSKSVERVMYYLKNEGIIVTVQNELELSNIELVK